MSELGQYRYRPFGSFRLFLAFLVVLQHFVANVAPLGPLYYHVLPYELGGIAVLVFFCMSGFVITEAVVQIYSQKPVAYLTNRFLRIAPHFIVALLIAVVLHAAFHQLGTLRLSDREHPDLSTSHAFDLINIVGNVFGFLPGVNHLISFDFVDIIWAVRVEMTFYFAVFVILLRPGRQRLWAVLPYALIALGVATMFVATQFGFAFFFLFGVLLYHRRDYRLSLPLIILGMSLYFILWQSHEAGMYLRLMVEKYLILAALIGFMTMLAFRSSDRLAFDKQCGDLSYPLYVHHQNMAILVLSLTAGYSYSMLAFGILLSFVASYVLMRLVDPAVNRIRDSIRGRRLERVTLSVPVLVRARTGTG